MQAPETEIDRLKASSAKPDAQILAEAIRLVQEGVSVTFPVNGHSMLPFIVGGRDSVVLCKPEQTNVGDIVLAQTDYGYVIHRVVAVTGEHITLMGDGNLAQREHCDKDHVFARVSHIVRANKKKHPVDSLSARSAAKIWLLMLPFRRYLQAIYRRIVQ
jgi:signal peptidase I